MKPSELYARSPEVFSHDLYPLRGWYYDHVPEVKGQLPGSDNNNRIRISIYKEFNFDSRRFWRLASVWFDLVPFMIIQNAGREGDDHHKRFVTDLAVYRAATSYLQSLCVVEFGHEEMNVTDENTDVSGLDNFYGNTLDGFFERARH